MTSIKTEDKRISKHDILGEVVSQGISINFLLTAHIPWEYTGKNKMVNDKYMDDGS